MTYGKLLTACEAAFWMMRSEARRQQAASRPDCDWKLVEVHEECVAVMLSAQAELCMRAMQRPRGALIS